MENKTIDGCCEYEGQVLPSKRHPFGIPCNHSCHSKAPTDELNAEELHGLYQIGFQAGKSEAFSLVREMISELQKHRPINEVGSHLYDVALTDLLSTLEGK